MAGHSSKPAQQKQEPYTQQDPLAESSVSIATPTPFLCSVASPFHSVVTHTVHVHTHCTPYAWPHELCHVCDTEKAPNAPGTAEDAICARVVAKELTGQRGKSKRHQQNVHAYHALPLTCSGDVLHKEINRGPASSRTMKTIAQENHQQTNHATTMGDWLFVFPLCGFSLSLFCNYHATTKQLTNNPEACTPVT